MYYVEFVSIYSTRLLLSNIGRFIAYEIKFVDENLTVLLQSGMRTARLDGKNELVLHLR